MKVKHFKTEQISGEHSIFTLADIADLTDFLREINTDYPMSSKAVSMALSKEYSNLIAIPVKYLIHDGIVETSHWVNLSANTKFVIDVTGDRFSFKDFKKYQNQAAPWIYYRGDSGSRTYYSCNHMPCSRPSKISSEADDMAIASALVGTSLKGTRCVYV